MDFTDTGKASFSKTPLPSTQKAVSFNTKNNTLIPKKLKPKKSFKGETSLPDQLREFEPNSQPEIFEEEKIQQKYDSSIERLIKQTA